MTKNFYTPKQLATLLGFSTNTIYKYLEEGRIKASRLGKEGRFRIAEEEVAKLLGQDTDRPPAERQSAESPLAELTSRPASLLEGISLRPRISPHENVSLFLCMMAVIGVLTSVIFLLFSSYNVTSLKPEILLVGWVVHLLLIGAGTTAFIAEMISQRKIFKSAWLALALLFFASAVLRWLGGDLLSAGWLVALPITMILSRLLPERDEPKLFGLLLLALAGLSAVLVELGIGWTTEQWLDALLSQRLPQHEVFLISCALVGGAGIVLLLSQAGLTTIKKLLLAVIWLVALFFTSVAAQALLLEQATVALLLVLWITILISPWPLISLGAALQIQFPRFLTMTASALVLAILYSLIMNWYGNQTITQTRDLHLAATQSSISQFLEENRRSILLANQFENLGSLLANPYQPSNLAVIQQAEKAIYLSSTSFQRVTLLSADGRVVDAYPNLVEARGVDLSDRDYFKRLVEGESLAISDTLVPRITQRQLAIINLAYAIRSESGEFLGAVIGLLDLEQLIGETNSSAVTPAFDSYLLLVDTKGIVFVDSRAEKDRILLSAISIENEGSLTKPKNYLDSFGLVRQRIAMPHESSDWYLVLDYPIEELFAHYGQISYIGFVWIFFSGLLLALAVIRKDKPELAVSGSSGKNL